MIFLLFVLGFVTYLVYFYMKVKKLPPGPLPFPLVGNLIQLGYGIARGRPMVEVLRRWQEKYGDVYTLWIGPLPTVNICDHQKAQEAMVKKGSIFADRPFMYLMWVVREGRGVIWSNGQHWTEQRRFALHTMRNFGLGRNLMEERIMLEVDYRINVLNKEIEAAGGHLLFDPVHHFDVTVGNIINRILFAERFTKENEKKFFDIKEKMDKMMEEMSIYDFFLDKWNENIPPFKARHKKIIAGGEDLMDFLKDQVTMRREEIHSGKRTVGDEPECYVDAFFSQMQKEDTNKNTFNEEALIITLMDLWFAGQETTATTLYWAFSYLTLHPMIIFKAQEELDKVTGKNRPLSMADKPNTPYLCAVISEILRMSSIVILNLWRNTAEDTQVGDYLIEEGTAVTAQLSLIMTDPKHFINPYEFNPERFLNNNLDQLSTPFGMGKRACLGESLARAELYLILGNLLLTYNFMADPKNLPQMRAHGELSNIRRANPYKLIISKRN